MSRPPPPGPTRPRAPNARSVRSPSGMDDTHPSAPRNPPDEEDEIDTEVGVVLDDRYRIEETIGRGGMGTVYRAVQMNVGREVALKTLSADREDPDYEANVARFESEARIVSQLRHPNTLRLFDFGKLPDGRLYIVSELLHGCTLDQVIDQGPLEPRRVAGMIAELADALVEAHEKQIVHRDLKPKNIFLDRVGDREMVKVLDFGIAKLSGTRTMTEAGIIVGSPAYVSPEQARGRELTTASDIYSLGVVAFECLSGHVPFSSVNAQSLLLKHVNDPPPPIAVAVPAELDVLVRQMLAKEPEQRPANMREIRDRMRAIALEPPPPPPVAKSRRPLVFGFLATLVFAIAATVTFLSETAPPIPLVIKEPVIAEPIAPVAVPRATAEPKPEDPAPADPEPRKPSAPEKRTPREIIQPREARPREPPVLEEPREEAPRADVRAIREKLLELEKRHGSTPELREIAARFARARTPEDLEVLMRELEQLSK